MPPWFHDVVTAASVLVAVIGTLLKIDARNQTRHIENTGRFASIEAKLDPIHDWYVDQINRRLNR